MIHYDDTFREALDTGQTLCSFEHVSCYY